MHTHHHTIKNDFLEMEVELNTIVSSLPKVNNNFRINNIVEHTIMVTIRDVAFCNARLYFSE